MKVLLSVASFDKAYGGPARSVAGLASALVEAGARVGIWAPDGSAPRAERSSGVEVLTGGIGSWSGSFGRPDILHDNGIWLAHNHGLARYARELRLPRVVSTRGMLEPWALRHRWWKKKPAWWFYQKRDLAAASALHATSEAEAAHLREFRLPPEILMLPNGVRLPEAAGPGMSDTADMRDPSIRTVLFVGRLHPVKGLDSLLRAWALLRPAAWSLRLVGPDEGGHRAELERLVAAEGMGSGVSFAGIREGGALQREYRRASLFVLPSRMESFGMAVVEAFAHGLPVITTAGTPWRGIGEEGCGWCCDGSVSGLAAALREAVALSPDELARMGGRGRKLVAARYDWNAVAAGFLDLYKRLAAGGSAVIDSP
jgi:glycosyltransferase involved in cell wall biosynthesis